MADDDPLRRAYLRIRAYQTRHAACLFGAELDEQPGDEQPDDTPTQTT